MSNISTATYIKKLVKMVYQKQKQIQTLKKDLKDTMNSNMSLGQKDKQILKEHKNDRIDDSIKNQMFQTSAQLKEVNMQVNAMEKKIIELEEGLQEQTLKKQQYQEEIQQLKLQNFDLTENEKQLRNQNQNFQSQNTHLHNLLSNLKQDYMQLINKYESLRENMEELKQQDKSLKSEKHSLIIEIDAMRCENSSHSKIQSQNTTTIFLLKQQMEAKIQEYKLSQIEKIKQIQSKSQKIQQLLLQIDILKHQLDNQSQINKNLQDTHEATLNQLNRKTNQYLLLSQKLKDYEQFALQISRYIESSYIKYCSQGVKSSRKLIKDFDSNKFQLIFKKMTIIQNWMESTSQKLEKLMQQYELPNQTLDDLSHIMNSFQVKLNLCDFTQQNQKQKQQIANNEQLLIKNLEQQCQKSYEHQRTKLVELMQVKQVLKMTKDVNRQLMDQINKKEYIISECKKVYQQLIGNKNSNQIKNLKQLLQLKF